MDKETSGKDKVGEDFPFESSWDKFGGEGEKMRERKRKKKKRKRREDE